MVTAPSAGTLTIQLATTGRRRTVLASGRWVFASAGKRTVVLRLSSQGLGLLRHSRRLNTILTVTFTPRGAGPTSGRRGVSIPK